MKISILGCGWLGFPLAKHLIARGFTVKGSTTSSQKIKLLSEAGVMPFLLHFNPQPEGELRQLLLATDVLVICMPPRAGKYGDDFHVAQIKSIVEALDSSNLPAMLYTSSTSVYPETNETIDENAPTLPHSALVKVEEILKNSGKPCTILRCGGLMGYDRIPAKYVAGKTVSTGHIPVNFVHQDDVVGIITKIIEDQLWGKTYNVVAPQHPLRADIYQKTCTDFGYALPIFATDESQSFKIISPQKLIDETGYSFIFDDPMQFSYTPFMG